MCGRLDLFNEGLNISFILFGQTGTIDNLNIASGFIAFTASLCEC